MIIAVDGPAASGKGTIAKALARHYGLPCLDTGLLYRAVGLSVLKRGGDPDIKADALAACDFGDEILADPALRSEAVGSLASRVSVHQAVRDALIARQRDFATQPGGAILDGRDIGTVIAPDADAKIFVTASVHVRAERRYKDSLAQGGQPDMDSLIADIQARDTRDMSRDHAPLKIADGADLLDTSDLTIDAAVQRAIALVDAQLEGRPAG
ncbi:MAG: (d)CMP kinase [Sphingobium sp.]|uniref:Cytidylate kinase n=1 Tax=Sphingobium xenophagum TaxID=121428 RepID=A0A249MUT1_SPHXE|nr:MULTISPECIES: (d)CMP kinase [Sphingobium]MBU0659373.1 (d)CMP kinase [Alphaproteobacteria bacterium]ASY45121.1 (d)CMP kinase [Sphingobium xenophagum]MBA4754721.1 (d)CMP kinase [Sphingobium sp.]MBG6116487.1 cytidylate kinase [Sphingobium sp. JAI105]MBS88027.1 (d)CMP kinase [Sphingobium sp.]|tara:strand:+ start:351 stop:986 length:636 start_codon:yes stop_codon:yes gene_type:complete